MAVLTMPQLGESVTEGTILRWLKQPGDSVVVDEPLVEVETEKVDVEIPSPFEGTLTRQLVGEGETAPVGMPLAEFDEIGAAGSVVAAPVGAASRDEGDVPPPAERSPTTAPSQSAVGDSVRTSGLYQKRRFSPAVARLAGEHGIDPTALSGTGAEGRVTRKDVEHAVAAGVTVAAAGVAAPTPTAPAIALADQIVTFSPTRRRIGQRLMQAAREIPSAWLMVEADVTGLVQLRQRRRQDFRAAHGADLTYLAFVLKAVTRALGEYPALNATWSGDDLIQRAARNVGVAVDTAEGLIVPVVAGTDRLTVSAIAVAIADLSERARSRRLTLADIEGGTFTVDNTGVFGTVATGPIINYPQVAILTTEAVVKRPVVVGDDAIAVRSLMNLTLTFDHRVADGSTAAAFTRDVRDRLRAIDDSTSID